MTVTATMQPSALRSEAGRAATLTLQLHNDDGAPAVLQLTALGELAEYTTIQPATVHLGPEAGIDVPIVIDLGIGLPARPHTVDIEVLSGLGDRVAATASIDVEAPTDSPPAFSPSTSPLLDTPVGGNGTSDYSVSLSPARSTGATNGRHRIVVDNSGKVPVMVEVAVASNSDTVEIDVAAPMINVDPGKDARIELQAHPRATFWTGGPQEHPFDIKVTGDDGRTQTLNGVYEQGPRLRPWLVPAAVGALGGLALSALAWFALLRPATESIADDRAAAAIEEQQAAFDDKILELEQAAERARQLPLGVPADLRLNVEAAPGTPALESYTVASDRRLSVTDVIFQNPDGAVGRVALLRNDVVLLESELANFRDLDLHFVAPFAFTGSDTVEVRLECATPGPDDAVCAVGVTIIGFVDQVD